MEKVETKKKAETKSLLKVSMTKFLKLTSNELLGILAEKYQMPIPLDLTIQLGEPWVRQNQREAARKVILQKVVVEVGAVEVEDDEPVIND